MQTWLGCCNLKSPPQWNVRVWPQTGTTECCWSSKHQRRQNIIWIHEVFFFSFCVSLERHVKPLLILALTVRAHCQLRLKHVNALNLLLSHSKTKINQRMLRLQAVSAWSLKVKDWRVKNWSLMICHGNVWAWKSATKFIGVSDATFYS